MADNSRATKADNRLDKAELPNCTAHGLRKARAHRLAEAGATPHEIAAVTGHATLAEVERYTRAAERAGMADSGFAKMGSRMNREQNLASHPTRFAKSDHKRLNPRGKNERGRPGGTRTPNQTVMSGLL